MDKRILIILGVTGLLIIVFLAHNYVFSIYETKIMLSRERMYADGNSAVTILAIPVNGLGYRAPWRKSNTEFKIEEGRELVEIVRNDSVNGIFTIKAKFGTGKVIILAKPKYALLPTRIEIIIDRNYA